jgi:hypothetical protein
MLQASPESMQWLEDNHTMELRMQVDMSVDVPALAATAATVN